MEINVGMRVEQDPALQLRSTNRVGAVADIHCDRMPEIVGPARLAWLRDQMRLLLHGSGAIVAASRPLADGVSSTPGIYFLIWKARVCYVGQASCIHARICEHGTEGRPFDRVAIIAGLPKWAQTEIEHAYIAAWNPPWNSEGIRNGQLGDMPDLLAAARALDSTAVMPEYWPKCTHGIEMFWPRWRQQELGRLQWEAGETIEVAESDR